MYEDFRYKMNNICALHRVIKTLNGFPSTLHLNPILNTEH